MCDANPISDVKFVHVTDLVQYGFSEKWAQIVREGFVDAPRYVGLKINLGL
jgi:hypothetical protein